MSAIDTQEYGVVHERVFGGMAVMGHYALNLDSRSDTPPPTDAEKEVVEHDAHILRGSVAVETIEVVEF